MPLYEYQCDACGHRFEIIQKFADPPVETCDKCGGSVRKLLSSPAIQFKGSGWYITDYARAGKSDSAAKGEGSGSSDNKSASEKSDSKAETKADSKTETKSESKPAPPTSTS
jgi:putative FmdB family regulatory protein